jgi:hypothetical protein
MGSILGSIGGIFGAGEAANTLGQGANNAANADLTGFNWLSNNGASQAYINAGQGALGGQQNVQNQLAGLLGIGGNSAQAQQAFNNYKNSTGYDFQLQQGQRAINSNSASSGMLDSGANAKALAGYGQNLASTTFNNYLGQLGGLNSAYGGTAGMGQGMLGMIGQAGTQGGVAAGNNIMQGAQGQANAYAGMGQAAGNALGSLFGGGGLGGLFSM